MGSDVLRRHGPAVALLALVAVPSLSWRLADCPRPWFDEGLRTNMARTLLVRGQYGTLTSDGLQPFSPIPSSGPLEIVAVAASFGCFGVGMAQARLPVAAFALIAVLLLYAIAQWLWGPGAALFAVLVVLAFPRLGGTSLLFLGRQVMGETPSLALGLASLGLLFGSWSTGHRGWAVAAGATAVLAVLSKGQIGVGLIAALAFGTLAWSRRTRSGVAAAILPPAAGAAVVSAVWWAVRLAATTAEARSQNAETMAAQVFSHVLVLDARQLPEGAWLVFGVLLAGFAAGLRSLRTGRRARQAPSARGCAEIALVAFVGFVAVWFISLSRGWGRYAYAALVIAELFLGRAAYVQWLRVRGRFGLRVPPPLVAGVLGAAALAMNLLYVAGCPPAHDVRWMADHIRDAVPRAARIESVEWEIDALSAHWNFHHPEPAAVRTAVEQLGRGEAFRIPYDALQADPDYLLKGPFSDWVRLYDDAVVASDFEPVATFGPYRLYRRIRALRTPSSSSLRRME